MRKLIIVNERGGVHDVPPDTPVRLLRRASLVTDRLPELLDCKALRAELGVTRAAAEAAGSDPPSAADVDTIIANGAAMRWRLPLRVLEQTGMRVGELQTLAWGDVDEAGSRFRIKAGQDRCGPPVGRRARLGHGRGRGHVPARGPNHGAAGVRRLHGGRRQERDGEGV